jgi:hypothetical protein
MYLKKELKIVLTSFSSKTEAQVLWLSLCKKSAVVNWFVFLLWDIPYIYCCVSCKFNNLASWSERPFIVGIISNLSKYVLSIKKLSIVEKECKVIRVGKLTLLLRLYDCNILSSWGFFFFFLWDSQINVSTYNTVQIVIKKFRQSQIK